MTVMAYSAAFCVWRFSYFSDAVHFSNEAPRSQDKRMTAAGFESRVIAKSDILCCDTSVEMRELWGRDMNEKIRPFLGQPRVVLSVELALGADRHDVQSHDVPSLTQGQPDFGGYMLIVLLSSTPLPTSSTSVTRWN